MKTKKPLSKKKQHRKDIGITYYFSDDVAEAVEELKKELKGKLEYNGHLVVYEIIDKIFGLCKISP